jgi:hypothetical protein
VPVDYRPVEIDCPARAAALLADPVCARDRRLVGESRICTGQLEHLADQRN